MGAETDFYLFCLKPGLCYQLYDFGCVLFSLSQYIFNTTALWLSQVMRGTDVSFRTCFLAFVWVNNEHNDAVLNTHLWNAYVCSSSIFLVLQKAWPIPEQWSQYPLATFNILGSSGAKLLIVIKGHCTWLRLDILWHCLSKLSLPSFLPTPFLLSSSFSSSLYDWPFPLQQVCLSPDLDLTRWIN